MFSQKVIRRTEFDAAVKLALRKLAESPSKPAGMLAVAAGAGQGGHEE